MILKSKRNIQDIDYLELHQIIKTYKDVILLDVRSIQEFNEGHLEGAINIPLYELQEYLEMKLTNKEKIIIVYCQSGIRSKKAIKILYKKGYKNLYHLNGGLDEV